ncbi:MAG: ferredoxin/flavodoxin---NADP+ reductase [Mycobacterium sp.]|jgi:ferredoxin--NADP+ reductase|nr:4Fe-4S ferredoxin, iron-sulfur binding protein [Mycobacterium sp.]MDT5135666.1 ferredoxin/flavodoxin---NADP+ reductase [Mycobacterium sp.]
MPHVITQSCCSDGSCVYACPVNCIHPTPDEPGFATAEMLHIDPVACVDCGACVAACPVGAIAHDTKLTAAQLPFVEINASFYPDRPADEKLPPTSKLAPVVEAPRIRPRPSGPLRVAVIGSGPAAMYAADELLTQHGVLVNVFERLATPYGLVRAGVAPDHQSTKRVTRLFDRMSRDRDFNFYLNVDVGQHVSHDELLNHHHAVIYAVGASADRRLDVPGFGLPGTATATEVVAWYNAHPDFARLPVALDHERVVIVGNGNVALDVARILTADPGRLACTDISRVALEVLRDSKVREVVVAARRGPAHSAFTRPEMIGLTSSSRVVLTSADHDLVRADLAGCTDALARHKLELLGSLDVADDADDGPRIRLAYRLTPRRVLGSDRAHGVEFTVTGTDETRHLDAGLVLSSIGYRGRPVPGLPFDQDAAAVPNRSGRVMDPLTDVPLPGCYVAGWIKRGPTGFIGTNKSCAQETVNALVDDYNSGSLVDPLGTPGAMDNLVRARQPDVVDRARWRVIDHAEIDRGRADGRPRDKFHTVAEMLAVTAAAPPARSRRLLAGLRRG